LLYLGFGMIGLKAGSRVAAIVLNQSLFNSSCGKKWSNSPDARDTLAKEISRRRVCTPMTWYRYEAI
jgi:hypothetical protein